MSDLSSIEDPITFFQARKPDLTVEEVLDSLWLLDCIAKYEPLAQKVENSPLTPATPSSSPTEKTNSAGKERQGSSPFDALPPSPPEPLVKVHLPSPQPTALGSAGGGGLPYRSQAVETLPQALLFNRALRLFKRTVKSRRYMVLDEEATIKRIADTAQEIWLPQLKPEIEKWLEVAVIVDLNSTMLLWHKSVDLFSRLLARHGAFRRVTFWGMDQDEAGVYFQLQGRDKQNSRQRQGLPGAGGGKQLIFVVSDCLSPAWQNGAVGRLLKNWQEHHLVSLIQVLPEWLWERTALGSAEKVFLSAREPVLTNRGLQPDSLSAALPKTVLKLPVISLSPEGLTNWAKVVRGDSRVEVVGFWLPSVAKLTDETPATNTTALSTPEKIEQFRLSASPLARELAVLLSGLPLNLQVVRLACRKLLPEAGLEQIAEVFLSGLVERLPGQSETTPPEELQFQFVEGAREILQKSLRNSDISRLIGQFLEGRGDYGGGFPAVIVNPEAGGNVAFNPASLPFAQIAAKLLRRFGNKYAKVITLLEDTIRGVDPVKKEQERLFLELKDLATSHTRRRDIGDRLNEIGDPRRGVGLDQNGLPDIEWLPVFPGGQVKIENQTFTVAPFYIARYPITNLQYEAFVKAKDGFDNSEWWKGMPKEYQKHKLKEPNQKALNHPRDELSWYQSVAFSRWLQSRLKGLELSNPDKSSKLRLLTVGQNAEIRLPTEWEWQWAAQGGSEQRKYPWGKWKEGYANTWEAKLQRTVAVGMYPQGAALCGAEDMSGNMDEWCLNEYSNPSVIIINDSTNNRVLRGGSFSSISYDAASAYRYHYLRYGWGFRSGCRVVLSPPIRASDL